jgi:hypothetical protein
MAQRLCRAPQIGLRFGPAARDQILEPIDIPLARPDPQPVCAPVRLEPAVSTQRLPQGGHLVVQHLRRRRRGRLPPQRIHQPIAPDQLVRAQDQKSQQRALSPRPNRQCGAAITDYFERSEHAEVQG